MTPPAHRGRRRPARAMTGGTAAALLGALPHVLHHLGPIAGAALFAGAAGSVLFGALGLLFAVPFLARVRRRSGGLRRPLAYLALFAAMFLVSTFAIGPALRGDDGGHAQPPQHQRHHP